MVNRSNEYRVRVADTVVPSRNDGCREVELWLGGCIRPRLDALLARQLGISRNQVKGMWEDGLLWDSNGLPNPSLISDTNVIKGCGIGHDLAGRTDTGGRVRNGQIVYISRKWPGDGSQKIEIPYSMG